MLFYDHTLVKARHRQFLQAAKKARASRKGGESQSYSLRDRLALAAGRRLVAVGKRLQCSVPCKPAKEITIYS